MTDCMSVGIRDRLPGLVHESLSVSEREEVLAHLATCVDCSAELGLVEAVYRSRPTTHAVDVTRITAALSDTDVRNVGIRSPWLRIAAAIVVASLGGLGIMSVRRADSPSILASIPARTAPPTVATSVSPAAAPRASLATGAEAAPRRQAAPGIDLVSSISEVSDAELAALTAELDGMESRPVAEPESITIDIGSVAEEEG